MRHVPVEPILAILAEPEISAPAKLVLIRIADRQGQNADAWPTIRTLAADCGLAISTTQRAIRELSDSRAVSVDWAGSSGARGRTNRYIVADRFRLCTGRAHSPDGDLCAESASDCTGRAHRTVRGERTTLCAESATNKDSNNVSNRTNEQKRRAATNGKAKTTTIKFPDALNTDGFRTAWAEWDTYRMEARKKLTPSTVEKQISQLEAMGHDRAISSIQQSIGNGWAGLFEPRGDGVRRNGQAGKAAGHGNGRKRNRGRDERFELPVLA